MASVFYESASELATLNNTFSVDGVPTDPATVTLVVTTPSRVSTTYTSAASEITRISTGAYSKDVACTEAGTWEYVWTGTGAASDVQAGTWPVWSTTLGRLYATVADLKARVGLASSDTDDDLQLQGACVAASRALEQHCRRTFWRTAPATVRTFDPADLYELRFGDWNDLVAITQLATDEGGTGSWSTVWSASDYQLLPLNPSAGPEQRPYTGLRTVGTRRFPYLTGYGRTDRIQITGTWGWPAVPIAIREAALIAAAELFKLKEAPFGVASFGEFGAVRIRDNPVVARLAAPYRLSPVGVA